MSDVEKFDQDLQGAMKDAEVKPVVLTEKGVATCVLMSYRHYHSLAKRHPGSAVASSADSQLLAGLSPGS